MNLQEVLTRIEGLQGLLEQKVNTAYILNEKVDLDSIAEGDDGVTVQNFLTFLEEADALESLFGGSSTAVIEDGVLYVQAPQGTKG